MKEEKKGFEYKFDSDKDGEASVGLKLNVAESLDEVFAYISKQENVKLKTIVKQEEGKLRFLLDADYDGEPTLEFYIDFKEAGQEAVKRLFS